MNSEAAHLATMGVGGGRAGVVPRTFGPAAPISRPSLPAYRRRTRNVSRRGLRSLRAGGLADDKKEVKMTGLETDPAVDGLDA